MSELNDEIERRRVSALNAIQAANGQSGVEEGVSLFVSHHLEELGEEYWTKHCGVARPNTKQVLDLLILQGHWGDDEEGDDDDDHGIDHFDFTLPDEVTNYVISVGFDESGKVCEVTMES